MKVNFRSSVSKISACPSGQAQVLIGGKFMGYYTYYKIDYQLDKSTNSNEIDRVIGEDDNLEYAFNGDESIKWYDHVDDMRILSLRFPKVLFTLQGEGEEYGDVWKKYFLNGQTQEAQGVITYPVFDKSKLDDCPKAIHDKFKSMREVERQAPTVLSKDVGDIIYKVQVRGKEYTVKVNDSETTIFATSGEKITNEDLKTELLDIIKNNPDE